MPTAEMCCAAAKTLRPSCKYWGQKPSRKCLTSHVPSSHLSQPVAAWPNGSRISIKVQREVGMAGWLAGRLVTSNVWFFKNQKKKYQGGHVSVARRSFNELAPYMYVINAKPHFTLLHSATKTTLGAFSPYILKKKKKNLSPKKNVSWKIKNHSGHKKAQKGEWQIPR